MNFGKVLTAMVTPFNQQGNIDFSKTTELIEHLIENGSDGLVITGTTGESPTLSDEEKVLFWHHVVKTAGGRLPIIAGTGSNCTRATVELSIKAQTAGVDAIMVVTPYYNKPNQTGLMKHFTTVASAVKIPVMLYNVPGRSVISLSPETIIRLSKLENIVAVKEASGNLESMAKVISWTDDDFHVYSGDDDLTLPAYSIGASGIVSVSSHIIGNEMQEMLNLFEKGDTAGAAALHRKLLPVFKEMFVAPSPAPVKAALAYFGIDTGGLRLPLNSLSEKEKEKMHQILQNLSFSIGPSNTDG